VADTVTLTLAHPLSPEQAQRVLATEAKQYNVGDKITVRRDYALSVIRAGFAAGVDPNDTEAVNKAIGADSSQIGEANAAQADAELAARSAAPSTKSGK
jgi:hypothetical protein